MKKLDKKVNKPIEKQFNINEEFETLQNQNKVLTHQVEKLTAKLNCMKSNLNLINKSVLLHQVKKWIQINYQSSMRLRKNHVLKKRNIPLKKLHISVENPKA
ncbi:hypothetical protein [Alkaliphilus sp. B6464]|uniref:hypothetical protein n=1 Tax=Alkaliphilus sp. B6464 TaxID=2731219 RepID=UPI0020114251|nr:hypothetical protein [Alkaliphilus sp. B6464]